MYWCGLVVSVCVVMELLCLRIFLVWLVFVLVVGWLVLVWYW